MPQVPNQKIFKRPNAGAKPAPRLLLTVIRRVLTVLGAFILLFGLVGILSTQMNGAASSPKGADGAELAPVVQAADMSTTTPVRVINALTIAGAVPEEGKFVGADLVAMKVYLYQDGKEVAEYPILTKGRPGTPFETPSGFYQILTKEENHLSSIGNVYMPYSMQFYGNYFIHGWPYYPDGTPVATSYSGGCIRLSTEDAGKVFAFVDVGTKMFVYDASGDPKPPLLSPGKMPMPPISAESYLVADMDTGEVYAERNAGTARPIASITKLMTALVANETISYERSIPIAAGDLVYPQDASSTARESVLVGDLFYPLLMESDNAVAHTLASFYGTRGFVAWMNSTAKSLDMGSTTYADASGESAGNVSTADDLFRLAVYLADKKSFIWKITRTPSYLLTADAGDEFSVNNFNLFSGDPDFIGGKVGQTTAAGETMLSVFKLATPQGDRRIAFVVLKSDSYSADTKALKDWFIAAAAKSAPPAQSACAACAEAPKIRVIKL